jgi:hypothetical protein
MSGFSSKTYSSVGVTGPLSSFNEINVAELSPVAQSDFIYGINTNISNVFTFAGGTVTAVSGVANVSSGTSITGSGDVGLRRNLKYRPGQGSLSRITGLFGTPASGNVQLVGAGNAESGYYFGYAGTNFGIIHFENSQREVRKLTVTTGAGTGLVTVTLDGFSVSVPVTGGNNVNRTSYELSKYNYSNVGVGWLADAIDGTVFFISSRPNPYTGSYSVAGASITGSFSSVIAGSGSTTTFISQSSWNIDKMDGTGQSRMVLDHQKGNVYQVGFQYLGFGNAFFAIEDSETGRLAPVHMIKNTNRRITPVLKNPQVTTRAVCTNIGGTSNVTLKTLSMASFIEGQAKKLDPRYSFSFAYNAADTSNAYQPVGAIKINRIYNGLTSFGEIDLLRIGASNTSISKNLTVSLFKNLPIIGTPNFTYLSETNSIISYANLTPGADSIDTAGAVALVTFPVGSNSSNTVTFDMDDLVVAAGEIIIVAIKTTGQVTGEVSINWYEQQ